MVTFTRTEMDEIASFSPDVERTKDRAEEAEERYQSLSKKLDKFFEQRLTEIVDLVGFAWVDVFCDESFAAAERLENRGTHVMTLRGKGLLLEATDTGETTT